MSTCQINLVCVEPTGSAALPSATLLLNKGDAARGLRIGRVAGVELQLPLTTISSMHCKMTLSWPSSAARPTVVIQDHSTNGVWVNRKLVTPDASGVKQSVLSDGDLVTLTKDAREGPVTYRILMRSCAGPSVASNSLSYSIPPNLGVTQEEGESTAIATRTRSRRAPAFSRDPWGEYDNLGELGSGGYSVVFKAKHKGDGREVAIKQVDISRTTANTEAHGSGVDPLEEEIRILKEMHHRHVVRLLETWREPGGKYLYLVMELVTGRELFDKIVDKTRFPEATARGLFRQIFDAVAYLHRRGCVHRDLKPENILLQPYLMSGGGDGLTLPPAVGEDKASALAKKYMVKITDFGMSRLLSKQAVDAENFRSSAGSQASARGGGEVPMSLDDLDELGRVAPRKRRATVVPVSTISMVPHSQVADAAEPAAAAAAAASSSSAMPGIDEESGKDGAVDRMNTVVGTQLYLAPEIRLLYTGMTAERAKNDATKYISHARMTAYNAAWKAGSRRTRDGALAHAPPAPRAMEVDPANLPTGYHFWPSDDDWTALATAVAEGYDATIDSWSLGVIMYVCLCGRMPFFKEEGDGRPPILVQMLTHYADFESACWHGVSDVAKDLVRALLHPNPTKRLTPAKALQHPWFQSRGGRSVATATDESSSASGSVSK